MIQLTSQKELRKVRDLDFCYWCGKKFGPENATDEGADEDHVPPKTLFDAKDRSPPLKLKTHRDCNGEHKYTDELMGQFIGRNVDYVPSDPKHRLLQIEGYPNLGFGAVSNVNVVDAIWRYIRGFHAALYREPLTFGAQPRRKITTPFVRAHIDKREVVPEDIDQAQYLRIVQVLKDQRSINNVDRIVAYNNQLKYECVWVCARDSSSNLLEKSTTKPFRACFFALDIYDWKQLGDVGITQARGCAGMYRSSKGQAPSKASLFSESAPSTANKEPWDPFGQ